MKEEKEYFVGNKVLVTLDDLSTYGYHDTIIVNEKFTIVEKHIWNYKHKFTYTLKSKKGVLHYMNVDTFVADTTLVKKLERILNERN